MRVEQNVEDAGSAKTHTTFAIEKENKAFITEIAVYDTDHTKSDAQVCALLSALKTFA